MKGINKQRIVEANSINLIDYLKDTDGSKFRERKNGTIVYIPNDSVVIWNDHSYDFGTVEYPYKDAIGTIRELYGYGFEEAIIKLEEYNQKHQTEIPNYTEYSKIFD